MERLPLPEVARLVKATQAVPQTLLAAPAVVEVAPVAPVALLQETLAVLRATESLTALRAQQPFMPQAVRARDTQPRDLQEHQEELR